MRRLSAARCSLALVLSLANPVLAQNTGDTGSGDSTGDVNNVQVTDSEGNTVTASGQFTPATTSTTTTYTPPFGLPAPGASPDAHLPSSSQAKSDINQGDSFDLNVGSGAGGGVVRGNADAAGVNLGIRQSGVPAFHTVKKGDTLWDLCARYYNNPWLWPQLWSYNPQLQNPHWIYPGDQLRLRREGPGMTTSQILGQGGSLVGRESMVPRRTVFLRHLGYIDDPKKDVWGELVGSAEEQQLLSDGNTVYLIMRPGVKLKLGQLLTVFRSVRKPKKVPGARMPPGELISFKGSVRITKWDPKTRVAEGQVVESLDVIERGAKIGPVGRRFDVVPPRESKVDLQARVLTSMYPHEFVGRGQVVFIDRGKNDGLSNGTRLFVLRKGDTWRRTLTTASETARSRVVLDARERVLVEKTPIRGDESKFPPQIIGELRVLRANKYSSLAIVIESSREIEPGDRAVARKGF